MERRIIRDDEVDTHPEIAQMFQQVFDNQFMQQAKIEQLQASIEKPKKKTKKKKGSVIVKTLISLVIVLLLAVVAFGEQQQINLENVQRDEVLTLILRQRLGRTGDTFTFSNGLTLDNATNNAFAITENSEDLILTFSSNAVTLSSSTSLASIDFGTVLPSFDLVTLKNGLTFDNDTDNTFEWNENSDELIMTFGSNSVTFSSGDVLTIGFGTLYQTFDQIGAPTGNPAGNKGWLYVKDNGGTTDLYFEDDGGTVIELTASASGVANLDEAYDGGGSGAGKAVTVDAGAIAFTATDAVDNTVLSLVQQDTAAASTLVITGSQATANAISIDVDAQTTGRDFEGTGASCYIEGDGTVVAVDVDITGAGGLILANDETITNNATTEITFTDSASSEDIIIDLDAGSNAVGWKSGSGVDEWAFGDVDDLTGISTVVFDATSVSITHTPDLAAEDFTIQQNGTTKNTSIIITTAGTPADALQLTASAGGIDISATSSDAGDDIDITATGTSINLTATENVADSIVIKSDNAGIDINAAAATAGEDIDITATGSSINVIATENQANAIVIDASDAAGGIDMDCGTNGFDLLSTGGGFSIDGQNTTANITLTANGDADDFTINAATGNNDSSLILESAGNGADALIIQTVTNGGGMDIIVNGAASDAGDLDISNTTGSINITANEDIADGIVINSAAGGIDITADGAAAKDLDLTCTNGSVILTSGEVHIDSFKVASSGGINMDAADDIDIKLTANEDGEDLLLEISGANDVSIGIKSSGTGASAIDIDTTAGGIDIDMAGGAAGEDFQITTATSIDFVTTETQAGQFKIDAQGAVAGNAIVLETTNGGLQLNVDGAGNGDITIDAQDQITIVSTDANGTNSIYIHANGGASEDIKLHSDQGTAVDSIELLSDEGGVTVNAAAANGAGLLTLNALISVGAAGTLADNATPDVSTTSFWETGAATTYTDFDVGTGTEVEGTIIIIKSLHAAVFDVTSTELEGGTTDITTASGDLTGWIYDGTAKWRLIFRMDMSDSAD